MKIVAIAILLSLFSEPIFAGEISSNYATIIAVHPVYRDNYITRRETRCRDVEVPIGGNELTGAIIGGAIGNQFGSGDGKDAMTLLGAIIGANQASSHSGYRIEKHCEDIFTKVNDPVISYYRIQYNYNGKEYFQDTNRQYSPGQLVKIQPSLK